MLVETSALAGNNAQSAVNAAGAGSKARIGDDDSALREVARQFEQVFIAQMLKQAKLGEASGPFSGGHGEDAFKSFLIDEHAKALTQSESFGLADKIYAQLKEKARADAE